MAAEVVGRSGRLVPSILPEDKRHRNREQRAQRGIRERAGCEHLWVLESEGADGDGWAEFVRCELCGASKSYHRTRAELELQASKRVAGRAMYEALRVAEQLREAR